MASISTFSNNKKTIVRSLLLALVILLFLMFYFLGVYQYLSFSYLKEHQEVLKLWTAHHYVLMSLLFVTVYLLATALAFPGAVLLTLAGGYLFGVFWGSIFVVIGATLGAAVLFSIVRFILADWLRAKLGNKGQGLRQELQQNGFNYLLILRLIPIFPFWLVNIIPALLDIPFSRYIAATFIGILPASIIYAALGSGLNEVFYTNKAPDLAIIFRPSLLLPLIGLAFLSLLPILYRHMTRRDTLLKNKR